MLAAVTATDPTSDDAVYRLLWTQPWSGEADRKVAAEFAAEHLSVSEDHELMNRYLLVLSLAELLAGLVPRDDVATLRRWVDRALAVDAGR